VVNVDDVVEPRMVSVGPAAADVTVIEKGIAEGERVVTDGQYKLQTNAPVTITAPPTAATQGNAS
jgi:membrane fusion protein, multidrug efflux system